MDFCKHCGRDLDPAGGHWCSQGAKAKMKADALYPEYKVPAPPTVTFTPKEIGLLQVGMVVAGLARCGNRPMPRTMEVLVTEQAAMHALTQKLVDIGEGLQPGPDEPLARSEAFDARGVRHKAFEEVLARMVAGITVEDIRAYCIAQFDATKGGV